MADNNKLRDTILDMEASLSTNLNGYSMWHYGTDIHGITRETLKNAIEALKAQEPRVLELSEIHRGVAVWLEDVVDKADAILAIGGSSAGGAKCFITENDISIAPLEAEYNVRWRAWTAEPTEEQRGRVKWDG